MIGRFRRRRSSSRTPWCRPKRACYQRPPRRDATASLIVAVWDHQRAVLLARHWAVPAPFGSARPAAANANRKGRERPQCSGPPLRTRGAQHQFRHVGATTPTPAHPPRSTTTCLPVAAEARERPPAERPVHGLRIQTALHASLPRFWAKWSVSTASGVTARRDRYRPTKALTRRIGLAREATGGRSPTSQARCWRLGTKLWRYVSGQQSHSAFHTKKMEARRAGERGLHQLSSWQRQSDWMGGLKVSLAGAARKTFDSGFSTPVERPYVSGVRVDVEASGRGCPSEGPTETPACRAEVGVARGGCFRAPPATPRSRSSPRGGPGTAVTHRLGQLDRQAQMRSARLSARADETPGRGSVGQAPDSRAPRLMGL